MRLPRRRIAGPLLGRRVVLLPPLLLLIPGAGPAAVLAPLPGRELLGLGELSWYFTES